MSRQGRSVLSMTGNGLNVLSVRGSLKPILTLGSCVTGDERKGPGEEFSLCIAGEEDRRHVARSDRLWGSLGPL